MSRFGRSVIVLKKIVIIIQFLVIKINKYLFEHIQGVAVWNMFKEVLNHVSPRAPCSPFVLEFS